MLEGALGIPVLRHREKKPAGGSEDMERHFGWVGRVREGSAPHLFSLCARDGAPAPAVDRPVLPSRRCKAEQLVMVGDRYLTDVVFGNRNGMLTIRPAPFTAKGEPKAVLLVSRPHSVFVKGRGHSGLHCVCQC